MYYLFIHKKQDLEKYKSEFERVKTNINTGKTPVYCELRCAKTQLIESVPYNALSGVLLILGTLLLNKIKINNVLSVAIVLIINNLCGVIANYLFTILKHKLRIKLCKRLGIDATEENIAVMESLEYQSV